MAHIKFGDKGKHYKIPEGYAEITGQVCQKGDMFFNLMTYSWNFVDEDDVEFEYSEFFHLIRRITCIGPTNLSTTKSSGV